MFRKLSETIFLRPISIAIFRPRYQIPHFFLVPRVAQTEGRANTLNQRTLTSDQCNGYWLPASSSAQDGFDYASVVLQWTVNVLQQLDRIPSSGSQKSLEAQKNEKEPTNQDTDSPAVLPPMAKHNSSSWVATDIGIYVGFSEVLFLAAQALTSIFWVEMADRFGGKTILIYILLGTSISSAIFGLSSSLWQMALCRCFMGMVSGGDVVVRAIIGKRCMTETEATRGFSLSSLAGNIGMASGLLIGHALVSHFSQISTIFKTVSFLGQYPFCLPGFMIGVMSATCALVATLFMDDVNEATDDTQSTSSTTSSKTSLSELVRSFSQHAGYS
ncbi:tetracycline resistance (probable transport) [Fusarium sp. NRRL 52700]|nr:tetracycline resistance (probable transport) [Fusarium sp. NRRL 52700]